MESHRIMSVAFLFLVISDLSKRPALVRSGCRKHVTHTFYLGHLFTLSML